MSESETPEVYVRQLDPVLASFGAKSVEFAARKAESILEACRSFGPPRYLKVLDLGCGPGLVTSFLGGALTHLTCVDSSPRLLEAARSWNPTAQFHQVDHGERLPFEDGEFEVVFFCCLLNRVPVELRAQFVAEAARVVKPGGKIICIEHNPANPFTRWVVDRSPFSEQITLMSAARVKELFRDNGLDVENSFFHVFFPGSIKALRPLERALAKLPIGGQHTVVGRRPASSDLPIDWEAAHRRPSTVRYSLVLTFFNEVAGIRKAVEDLLIVFREAECSFELILVDNGSIDGTTEIIADLMAENEEVRSVRTFPNRGYGWGVIHGLAASQGEAVGFAGGDGQIRPRDVVAVFKRFDAGDCELAKVRRVTRGDGNLRHFISIVWNLIFTVALGRRVVDCNGTPKVFDRRALVDLQPESRDWFLDSEVWMKALSRKWRIAEIEVDFLPREEGESHVRLSTLWEFLRNIGRWAGRYRASVRADEPL